jgi:hypothetical protein
MCHSGQDAALGLRLDSLDNLNKGSRKGPVAKAGDPAGSELIRRIKGVSQPRMPMTGSAISVGPGSVPVRALGGGGPQARQRYGRRGVGNCADRAGEIG